MMVSLEGFMRNISRNGINPVVQEFIDNLRELRDHPERHGAFFGLYVFRDDDEWKRRAAQAAEVRPHSAQQAQPATPDTSAQQA
jgi:hypothetical protein